MMGLRWWICRTAGIAGWSLVVCAVIAAVATPAASAQLNATATITPGRIVFPHTKQITYRLHMTTGEQAERFSVALIPPSFGRGLQAEGSPVRFVETRLEGPGELTTPGRGSGIPFCSTSRNAYHGYEPRSVGYDIALPPQASSTLTATYNTGLTAPWPTLDYRLTFLLRPELFSGGQGTLVESATVRPPQPEVAGRFGVEIRLAIAPYGAARPFPRFPEIKSGRRIRIAGRTSPRLRRQIVNLRYTGPGSRTLRPLATVRTDWQGRFAYRKWAPRRPGRYEVWAFYRSQRRHLVSDYTCPRSFQILRAQRR